LSLSIQSTEEKNSCCILHTSKFPLDFRGIKDIIGITEIKGFHVCVEGWIDRYDTRMCVCMCKFLGEILKGKPHTIRKRVYSLLSPSYFVFGFPMT